MLLFLHGQQRRLGVCLIEFATAWVETVSAELLIPDCGIYQQTAVFVFLPY